MRKISQNTWNNIDEDYKIIKGEQKYAMVDGAVLEPVEIDEVNGENYVKYIFKIGTNGYKEVVLGIFNPLLSKEINFENNIKKCLNYKGYLEYCIENKKYEIIDIVDRWNENIKY